MVIYLELTAFKRMINRMLKLMYRMYEMYKKHFVIIYLNVQYTNRWYVIIFIFGCKHTPIYIAILDNTLVKYRLFEIGIL